MTVFTCILLGFLLLCAVAVSFTKNMLTAVLIFMSFSLVLSIIWLTLESPDLGITEAAVGAGVTSLLFFLTLRSIRGIMKEKNGKEEPEDDSQDV